MDGDPVTDHGQSRRSDPETARSAALAVRPGSARSALLMAHARHRGGLTDEEAVADTHLSATSEYPTRCSELMRDGYLVDTALSRPGASGQRRLVRRITPAGLDALGIDPRPQFGDVAAIRANR